MTCDAHGSTVALVAWYTGLSTPRMGVERETRIVMTWELSAPNATTAAAVTENPRPNSIVTRCRGAECKNVWIEV